MANLYLDGRVHARVLRDGPALRLRMATRADRLYPLRRLDQIISIGRHLAWDTDALLLCAQCGNPVYFLSAAGELTARLLPGNPCHRGGALQESLLAVMENRADATARYRAWLRERMRQAGRSAPSTALLQRWAPKKYLLSYLGLVHGLLQVQLHAQLRRTVDLDAAPLRLAGIDLAADLARLCLALHAGDLGASLKRLYQQARRQGLANARPGHHHAVQWLESHLGDLLNTSNTCQRALHLFLLELIEDHDPVH